MNAKHLGDSYDLVKQALIRALLPLGQWLAHPMLTEPFSERDHSDFRALLGIDLLSPEVLQPATDRRVYFYQALQSDHHLFLDPDIGLRLAPTRGKKAPAYLFGDELVEIATRRGESLTLVYDQSHPRGGDEESIRTKLAWLRERRLFGLAYSSHASFLLLSPDGDKLLRAREALLANGRIPQRRLVQLS